jgi:serine/threonine-protein phosphatase 6 regulatory ankyrin repeat subunit B
MNLFEVARTGRAGVVKALIKGGWFKTKADVNAKASSGYTALMAASQNGHLEVVQALLAAKADANAKSRDDGTTALIIASQKGHLKIVQALLAANADVNARMNDGGTALMAASAFDRPEVVKVLLAAKADVNAKRNDGFTALMFASQKGCQGIVQLLKEAGAGQPTTQEVPTTAAAAQAGQCRSLLDAAFEGDLASVKAQLADRADVNNTDYSGRTALMHASLKGHSEIVRALLAANARVDAK